MPSRGRVKIKKIMPKGSDEDANVLNDMFEQMTGSQHADEDIVIPKLTRLHNLLNKFIKIYNLLLNFSEFIDKFQEYEKEFNEIKNFLINIKKIIDTSQELSEDKLKNMGTESVNKLYKTLKSKQEVQAIIVTSGNLGKHKRYLEDKNNLKDDFIKREPGLSLTPLTFTKLDLKCLWSSSKLTSMAKKYILNILNHTYNIGHEMYDVITSPDIDIKKFSKILISNIEKMKKTIPRCDKAFNIIKNSVELLENNFKGYYRNSVEAENPSIIVESFIIDVSMSQKANASITGQFRRIIMFMKKQAANNNDPRVKKLFKILNSQFDLMAQKTGVEDPGECNPEEQPDKEDEEEEETDDDIPDLVDVSDDKESAKESEKENVDEDDQESKEDAMNGMQNILSDLMTQINDIEGMPKEESNSNDTKTDDELEIVE